MTKPYFTVVVRDPGEPWGIHFGDYDQDVAAEEAFEATQSGYRSKDVKVIRSGDAQAEIEAAVAALNQ